MMSPSLMSVAALARKLMKPVLLMMTVLLDQVSFLDCEQQQFFNAVLHKRPTVFPPSNTCGQTGPSQFCENLFSEDKTCLNVSRCDVSCPSSFYYLTALRQADIILNALDGSRSSGWSSCVSKNFTFLCPPSEYSGQYSVRFSSSQSSAAENCSLKLDPSWLAPFMIAGKWNITISMWIYSEMESNSLGTLFEITSSSSSIALLRISVNSTRIIIESGSLVLQEQSWLIPTHTWTQLTVLVFDNFINIFVNGQFLDPGCYQLRLLHHNTAASFYVGQSRVGGSQFTGHLQNFQIYFGSVSNREVLYIYNGTRQDDELVQPDCTCPSQFPALVPDDSTRCQQNPGNLSLLQTNPRINHLSHVPDFITDGDEKTFWVSKVNSSDETASVVIEFGSIYQVFSVDLFFYSPFPLETTISKKTSTLLPWEPWQRFSRNCSDSWTTTSTSVPCVEVSDESMSTSHLVFFLVSGKEEQNFTLASAVNISMTGFAVDQHPLLRYHALYEVSVNATCHCYGRESVCDPVSRSCSCHASSLRTGPNCLDCLNGSYRDILANDDLTCKVCDCDVQGTVGGLSDCSPIDGQCSCKSTVVGRRCDVCADGYYDLSVSNEDGCQPCRCHANNTISCSADTGECRCKRNVQGLLCDSCLPHTYWSQTGTGCDDCNCSSSGTVNRSLACFPDTGQCPCKRNVGSRTCDRCKEGFYDLRDDSTDGCAKCNCSSLGTVDGDFACHGLTGQCNCRPGEGDVTLGGRKCKSYFSSFFPEFGPESGGTVINMTVGFIGDVQGVVASIGSLPCLVNYNISDVVQLVCITSPLSNLSDLLNQSLPVSVFLPSGQELISKGSFIYRPDPVIDKVWPLRTIESGGINLTVTGRSLWAVAFPLLQVLMVTIQTNSSAQAVTVFKSTCFHVEQTLVCPTPRLILPKSAPRTVRDVGQGNDADTSHKTLRFYIGFIFDGVEKYHNLSLTLPQYGLLDVYNNPNIYDFTEEDHLRTFQHCSSCNQSTISIMGCDLNLGAGISDYVVTVGLKSCSITDITSNQITCIPPYPQPEPENELFSLRGLPAVKVTVGNIQFLPGYLQYVEMKDSATKFGKTIGAAIAAGGVAVVMFVVFTVIARVLLTKRSRRRSDKHLQNLPSSTEECYRPTNIYSQGQTMLKSRSIYLTPVNSDVESFLCRLPDGLRLKVEDCLLEDQQLFLSLMIGQGNFGQVYVGELIQEGNVPMQVAVKTLKGRYCSNNHQDIVDFLEEATLMHQFEHEHILDLIGIVLKPCQAESSICVVLPYMENADLRSFVSNEANVLTVKALLEFGVQVANGMKFLESNKFVHRDLACRNCMVSLDLVVKVADFGLSRDIHDKDYYRVSNSKRPLPVKWMAIESLETGIFTTKSDVWSFGVLMWELINRGIPPYPYVDHVDIRDYLQSGKRLNRPEFAPVEIYSLMKECWQVVPEQRPSFHDIEERISHFLKEAETPPISRSKQGTHQTSLLLRSEDSNWETDPTTETSQRICLDTPGDCKEEPDRRNSIVEYDENSNVVECDASNEHTYKLVDVQHRSSLVEHEDSRL